MRFSKPLKRLFKATQFFQDNALIFRQFRYFPGLVALAILFSLLAALFEGLGISFLLGFLQNLINPNGEAFATGIQWFDVKILGVGKSDLNRLFRISGLILVAIWLKSWFRYLSVVYLRIVQERLCHQLHRQIYEQLKSLSLAFYGNVKAGNLINTLTVETRELRLSVNALGMIVSRGSLILVYVFVAFLISWQLTILVLFLFGLIALQLSRYVENVRASSMPVTAARGNFAAVASELIGGIRTIKAFSTEDFERQRFYQSSQEIMDAGVVLIKRSGLAAPFVEGAASTVLIGIIIFAMAVFIPSGQLQVASLLTFLFALFRILPILQQTSGIRAQLMSFQGSVHNIEELLRRDNKPYIPNGYRQFWGVNHAIVLRSVDFCYSLNSPVLRDITLSIEKGKTTALVGGSGAGKSTLADLVPRFIDPTRGEVLVDGVDLREFDVYSLRKKIGIVSQDTFIFHASVVNNIAYGSPEASFEDVLEAAEFANALQFIQKLPNGFETLLGDRGVTLSGGQRQRIAIARALLKKPEILILDEATSALDSVSEKLIQESLEKLSAGRTVITIAHRLSTVVHADKIVVLERGGVVEQGTCEELLTHRGRFWEYYNMQAKAS